MNKQEKFPPLNESDTGLKVGDNVVIINNKKIYNSYSDAFYEIGIKGEKTVEDGYIGEIIYICNHGFFKNKTMLAINLNIGKQCLMDETGVIKINDDKINENMKIKHPGKYKIWIGDNPELSKRVQKKLFELGYKWAANKQTVSHTKKTSLFLYNDGEITYGTEKSAFDWNNNIELTPQDLEIIIIENKMNEDFKENDVLIGESFLGSKWMIIYKHKDSEKYYHKGAINLTSEFMDDHNGAYIAPFKNLRKATEEDIGTLSKLGYLISDNRFVKMEEKKIEIPEIKNFKAKNDPPTLKLKDLKPDNIYVSFNKGGERENIFKFEKYVHTQFNTVWCKYIIDTATGYYYIDNYFTNDNLIHTIQEASTEEEIWLNECINANKFIPQDKALNKFYNHIKIFNNLNPISEPFFDSINKWITMSGFDDPYIDNFIDKYRPTVKKTMKDVLNQMTEKENKNNVPEIKLGKKKRLF